MKLVELLVRELTEWPKGKSLITQDASGKCYSWTGKPRLDRNLVWYSPNGKDFNMGPVGKREPLCADHATAIVTRADWDAERARIAKPAKANKDGWIRHRGGKCPVERGVVIDVRYRSGEICETVRALTGDGGSIHRSAVYWKHYGHNSDIMSWRLHVEDKPARQDEQPAYVSKDEAMAYIDHSDLRDRYEGPIKWRERISEIDVTTEKLTTERADLVQKLAVEGFALIERAAAVHLQEWMRHAIDGRKNHAIKHYRDLHGSGLRDAKDAVELYQSTLAQH